MNYLSVVIGCFLTLYLAGIVNFFVLFFLIVLVYNIRFFLISSRSYVIFFRLNPKSIIEEKNINLYSKCHRDIFDFLK
jgi:hypothetical protein